MLSKKSRLKIQDYISLAPTKVKRGRLFLIKLFPSLDGQPHLAVAVGKKVFASAAKRNHLRRLVSSELQVLLPGLPSQNYLIQVLPSASSVDEHVIIEELYRLLKDQI
ncbi:MAG: hypothetical protein COU10_02350 [Candidatus Harrisonbacteria bacterium CG10_big_fil_rev_8_21_14_0_10_45_28]|uniref:Uncharacterized protein n=1 Tax=Candidatus Harrisonbacteria bacterium CG10_big_fil_rev_8_21_14_0_10_45_28 TaxID=1974586 RepID=A0A2H0UN61_9BACT|nr:MAG: hypothetical protein COU10_02350 [Candidatus Harrisonbacteria bacterium CG10_big_fil_rev_8_21_14_0_10_45_28]